VRKRLQKKYIKKTAYRTDRTAKLRAVKTFARERIAAE
jgi:hypothetical protein